VSGREKKGRAGRRREEQGEEGRSREASAATV